MQPRNLAFTGFACLLTLLVLGFLPTASAENPGGYRIDDNRDFVISFSSASESASNQFDLDLRRINDANSDGDFADAGEDVSITSISNGANCNANAHISCAYTAATSKLNLVWRQATADHIAGDYTLSVRMENNIGVLIVAFLVGIQIQPAGATDAAINAARDSVLNSVIRHDDNMTTSYAVVGTNDQDLAFAFENSNAATDPATTQWNLGLQRLRDLNGDGDFADAGESTGVVTTGNTAATSCTSVPTILSCRISFSPQRAEFVFKNASADHVPGNYSAIFAWLDAGNNVVRRDIAALSIVPSHSSQTQVSGFEGNISSAVFDQHQAHDVNMSGFNATMRALVAAQHEAQEANLTAQHVQQNTNNTHVIQVTYAENEDSLFTWENNAISTDEPAEWRIVLTLREDLDEDGDYTDPGETTTLIDEVFSTSTCEGAAAAVSDHFSCSIDAGFRRAFLVWRNESVFHDVGNYSLEWHWRTSGGTLITRQFIGVALVHPSFTEVSETNIITNPRSLVDDEIARMALVVLAVVVLTLVASQPFLGRQVVAFFGGLGIIFLMVAHQQTAFSSETARQVFTVLGVIPMVVGSLNFVPSYRNLQEKRRGR